MPIIVDAASVQKDLALLDHQLMEFNRSRIEGYGYEDICLKITSDSDVLIAGIGCQAGGGWLYIASLWVDESHRGKGLGTQLLNAAERKGIEKGCHSAYLYTYSFQSPGFYEKNGYVTLCRLGRFCGDHAKIYLSKRLMGNEDA